MTTATAPTSTTAATTLAAKRVRADCRVALVVVALMSGPDHWAGSRGARSASLAERLGHDRAEWVLGIEVVHLRSFLS